jgi:hypothetical protein
VSGTLGLTGAADAIVIMKRHSGMVKVYVRGRDIEEAEFAAEFNKDTCRWRLVGEADEVFRSQQRQAIVTALKEAKRPMSVSEIMAATERRDRNSTEVLLHKMERAGEVKHVVRGQWEYPDSIDSGKIGKKVRNGNQVLNNSEENDADESYRDLTGAETGKIAVRLPIRLRRWRPTAILANLTILTILPALTGPTTIPNSPIAYGAAQA